MIKEVPDNIVELKKMSSNTRSWRERIEAISQLEKYDCVQSRAIVTRLALHDPVFKVKEAAFLAAQKFGVVVNNHPIKLGKGIEGYLVKGINKKLVKVRNILDLEFDFEQFKVKFKELYPEAYDIYEGEKADNFDEWLEKTITSLPK